MFKQGDLVVNIPFTTSQVDVVLNALQEKQLMIEELRQDIFDIAKEQNLKTRNELQRNADVHPA